MVETQYPNRFEIQLRQYGSRLEGYVIFDNETQTDIPLPKIDSKEDLEPLLELLNELQLYIDTASGNH